MIERVCAQALPLIVGIFVLFSIIVWDMDRQYDLSHAIHDDHAEIWQPMSSRDMYLWYSEVDICMLRGLTIPSPQSHSLRMHHHLAVPSLLDVSVSQFRLKNCSSANAETPSRNAHSRFMCAAGMSLGRSCKTPFASSSFYFHRLTQSNIGDPLSGNANKVLDRLSAIGVPIVFIGDQVSKQNQESLVCEALRVDTDGFTVSGSLDLGLREIISNVTLHWGRDSSRQLTVYFIRASRLSAHKRSIIRTYVDEISAHYRGLVLVASLGLGYSSRERFRADVQPLLVYLHALGADQRHVVLYRETSRQHWNASVNGYLPSDSSVASGSSSDLQCGPLEDASYDSDWRNKDVRNHIANDKLSNVHVIPFRDITAPLFNMHASDCTQFCYFPQLWQIVFHHMEKLTATRSFGRNASVTPVSTQLYFAQGSGGRGGNLTIGAARFSRTRGFSGRNASGVKENAGLVR